MRTRFADREVLHHCPGFTLIELLVVIAIIAVLASILFPVFFQVHEKARSTRCLSNLKQLTIAEMMYTQDYDETFGSAIFRCNVSGGGQNVLFICHLTDPIADQLPVYLKSREVLFCPDRHTEFEPCQNPNSTDGRCYGYGYNWGFYNSWEDGTGLLQPVRSLPDNGGTVLAGKTQATLARPTQTFLFGDTWDVPPYTLSASANWNGPGSARHSGGFNFSYADGHTKWVKMRHGITHADTHVVGNLTRSTQIPESDTLSPSDPNNLNSYCADPDGSDCNAIKTWFLQNTRFDNAQ